MPGNSQRRGAMRKAATRRARRSARGGQRRKGLEGRGPTPKAVERTKHPRQERGPRGQARRRRRQPRRRAGPPGRAAAVRRSARGKASSEIVAGRNSVVEALRAEVPVTTMYVAGRIDSDDRVREALKIATARGDPDPGDARAASSTGSPTARCTRGWRCRSRRTSTRTRAT